eukprot:TRINITY_DN2905_c0_g3_i1.p1 TRINITY_DN2905_c0_g3~~TRINITY_DN2905_c0_g3_i1.p1  ORF type:complete len:227 (-),score=39.43 TRINITY_DN2905_c0_g3_i1:435-1115(-)
MDSKKAQSPSTENVQVFLRMRPPNVKEREKNEVNIWNVGQNYVLLNAERFNSLITQHRMHFAAYTRPCVFNSCFDSNISNTAIYHKTLKTLVEGSLKGINGTLFMYGQTGSGKTYTMMGDYSEEVMSGQSKRNKTPVKCSTNSTTPRLCERSRTPILKPKTSVASSTQSVYAHTRAAEERPLVNEGVLVHSLRDLFAQIQKVFARVVVESEWGKGVFCEVFLFCDL